MSAPNPEPDHAKKLKQFRLNVATVAREIIDSDVVVTADNKKTLLEFFRCRENLCGSYGPVLSFSIQSIDGQKVSDRNHILYFGKEVFGVVGYAVKLRKEDALKPRRGKQSREDEFYMNLASAEARKVSRVVVSDRHNTFALLTENMNVTVYHEDTGRLIHDQGGLAPRRRVLKAAAAAPIILQ